MGVMRVVRVAMMLRLQIQKSGYRLRECRRSRPHRLLIAPPLADVVVAAGEESLLPGHRGTSLREHVF